MKKFFQAIEVDLRPYDVLTGGALTRAWDNYLNYLKLQREEVFRKYYRGDVVAQLTYSHRPFTGFVPQANGSRRSRS